MSKKPKLVLCRNCNASIAKSAKMCPSCGAKNKKPFYKRVWFIIIIIFIAASVIGSIGEKISKKKEKKAQYRWPTSELVSLLPQPESKYGKISSERESYFSIDIYDITNEQFEDYIDACKEHGFTEAYSKSDGYYHAENIDGVTVGLRYEEKEKEMSIILESPLKEQEKIDENQVPESSETESNQTENNETEKTAAEESNLVDGMRPQFKAAMDSCEAFYDDYCDFMKKYQKNPSDLKLIGEYTDMLKKLADMDEKFAEWEENDLNSAETQYYIEVTGGITQKLIEVAE